MREYVVQSLLHGLVAAAVVETLLRAWRVIDPGERLAYRLLVLTLPLLLPLLLGALAPFRLQPPFADTTALFASLHWHRLAVAGLPVDAAAAALASAAGVVLYVRDVMPLARSRRQDRDETAEPPGGEVVSLVSEIAPRLGLSRAPRVRRLATSRPVLFTAGVWRPALVVSDGALERLGEPERRAAIAHELAHVARRDLLLGWAVMLTRTILVHNPVVQVVARAAVQEMERRADDLAAHVTRSPGALAAAMTALAARKPAADESTPAGLGPFNDFLAELMTHGRFVALEGRRRRLLGTWPPHRSPLAVARFGLTAAATAGLLYFVV